VVDPSTDSVCRLTFVAPRHRVDLAMPTGVPLAEIAPVLLRHAGVEAIDEGATHGGWTLSDHRGPLDTDRTVAQLGLHDGDQIFLTEAEAAQPFEVFDDVAELVADSAARSAPNWSPRMSRIAGLGFAVVAAASAAALLGTAALNSTACGITGLVSGLALVLTGVVVSRAAGDPAAGATLAVAAVPLAFAGGFRVSEPAGGLAAPLLLAAVAMVLTALLGLVGTGAHRPVFVALLGSGSGLGVATATVVTGLLKPTGAAAAVAVAAILATTVAPALSLRLAGVPAPVVPVTADDIRTLEPLPDAVRLRARASLVSRYLEGLLAGTAVVAAAATLVLAGTHSVWNQLFSLSVAAALLLRARAFVRRDQRLVLLVAGLVAGAAGGTSVAAQARPAVLVALLVALFAVLAGCAGLAIAHRGPVRWSPLWGRLLDLAEVLVVVGLIPLALGVGGAYGAIVDVFNG
jgi:type VII secretion integral membrane protein EccD